MLPHRRTLLTSCLATTLAISVLSGCEAFPGGILFSGTPQAADSEKQRMGTLKLSLRLDSAQQLQYVSSDVHSIAISLRSGALSFARTILKADIVNGTANAEFGDLIEGVWTLGATAYDSNSSAIGGSTPQLVTVAPNAVATASLAIELTPTVVYPDPLPELPADGDEEVPPSQKMLDLGLSITDSQVLQSPLAGLVSTLAGNGTSGWVNAKGSAARFNNPRGIAIDAAGNLYVADTGNHMIRKVTRSGMVSTLAGNGTSAFKDGMGSAAQFSSPHDIAIDAAGNLFVADYGNNRIRKVTPAGEVSTIATGIVAQSVATDASGSVYAGDYYGVYKFDAQGNRTLLAGKEYSQDWADGKGSSARFNNVTGIAVDADGTLYVVDSSNLRIRRISPDGTVVTLAGNGQYNSVDGTGVLAQFNAPSSIAITASGHLLVGDSGRIRLMTKGGAVTTLVGFDRWSGSQDGDRNTARFGLVQGLALDSAGRLFAADTNTHGIRLVR